MRSTDSPFPTGTVTFLFTDIEGSTRHWELNPAEMQSGLSQHNALMRAAITGRNGVVFETAGDSFVAIFVAAADALSAALDAQHDIVSADWPEVIGTLKVRMALHTGPAEMRPDGYYAQHTLSRLSRIMASGYGGQILVSQATQELLRYSLPSGVELLGLGQHRLRDLIAPEQIFQVSAPNDPWNLPYTFPPLKTLDSRPNNLPVQLTPLIGREKEVAAVVKMLSGEDGRDTRIVTLTGPGGTGKTRVGLQVAADLIDRFEQGVCFVNLAPIVETELVVPTIAMSLGLKEVAGEQFIDTLKNYLKDRHILLLLDNFEQVAGAAPRVSQLAAAAPGIKILVTSRVPLRITGEKEYPIPPLSLPDYKHMPSLEHLTQFEAVRLFIERATGIKPDFQVTNENAPAVAEICVRLDGLPLAIELAAARIRLLSPQAMLSRLQNRLKLLTGGAQDVSARQQTLRGAIDWSYDLLTDEEKLLFRRLAVFVGGRSLDAIEAICSGGDGTLSPLEIDVLDGVEALVHHSLLKQNEGPDGEPRFMMLETIHEFAREKLEESGEAAEMRRAHAMFFVDFGEREGSRMKGSNLSVILDRLQREYGNLRAALEWCFEGASTVNTDMGVRLAAALWVYWYYRAYWSEGEYWLDIAIRNSNGINTIARGEALYGRGLMALDLGKYAEGRRYVEECVIVSKEAGGEIRSMKALGKLGDISYAEGDHATAILRLEEALAQSRLLDQPNFTADMLGCLGEVMRTQGKYREACEYDEEGIAIIEGLRAYESSSWIITNCNLGQIVHRLGDPERARQLLTIAMMASIKTGLTHEMALSLLGFAGVAGTLKEPERAARLFGCAEYQLELLSAKLWPADQMDYDHNIATARAQLDEATFERIRQEGRGMSLEAAVDFALQR